ncbi:OB-fold domain-containing protein [Streptomyces sp. H39-S7]|nr:OB-fold domain-containing protein [Streptomyces sp. H39-S7]MCZ4123488.1 OB-fold domain-containing protein [Streptomyces sp. H39-S7]
MYERLAVHVGQVAAAGGEGRDPVNEPMIRHWCEAMGHPVPADGSAPATMLQVWTMGGLSGHTAGTARAGAYDAVLTLLDEAGCTSVVATDCEQEYLRPLRPGDRITFDAVIESISPRKTTKLGTGHFVTTRMDVRANGELSGTHRFRILKYAPARTAPARTAPARTAQGQAAKAAPRRPRPVVNRDNAAYWEGLERHELLIQRCSGCGTLRLPWLPGCNACGSPDWDTVPAAGGGTVFSYVVMHHPPFPAFDPPYAVALVELAEGVRVLGNVTGVPYDKVRAGLPVTLEFLAVDDEFTLPVFRSVEAGED